LFVATLLSLSLLAGCKKDTPAGAGTQKDGDPPGKDADPKKDGEPAKDAGALKEIPKDRKLDVPFIVTPDEVVEKMLEVANLTDKDVVYDLGCGDGRIVIAAARKYGCKAVGYDLDPARIRDSEANKAKEPKQVQKLVSFVQADALEVDLRGASVIMVYMSADFLEKLTPAFQKMKPGSRIVSHGRLIPGATKDASWEVVKKNGFGAYVYLYVTPLKVED
jgi:SAM-dependent methyltransferase